MSEITIEPTPSKKGKRGSPCSNTNALKHGFYGHVYTPEEIADLKKFLRKTYTSKSRICVWSFAE